MTERLQKLISAAHVASRRTAEQMILDGRVTVNGAVAELGQRADPAVDTVMVDGRPLRFSEAHTYILLNKPRGYVTTARDERGRKTVMDLIGDVGVRLYPVGRLDMYSQGLLLLTNDGALTKALTHPSHKAEKQYQVRVVGDTDTALKILRRPMELDGRPLKQSRISVISRDADSTLLLFTISEGRNRQIRRMCEIAGLRVVRLRRIAEAGLQLGDLPEGKWRYLTDTELDSIRGAE